MKRLFGLLLCSLGAACGNDPFATLGNPSDILPNNKAGLNLPVGNGNNLLQDGVSVADGFSQNNPGISFRFNSVQTTQPVRSPGPGVVTAVQGGASNGYVLILHNARVFSRIINLQPGVQLGAYVNSGTVIGTFQPNTGTAITLSIFLDGDLVCPLTFLNPGVRTAIVNAATLSGVTIPLCQR
jgi:hypothetical protein